MTRARRKKLRHIDFLTGAGPRAFMAALEEMSRFAL